jgi:hypothetical protein
MTVAMFGTIGATGSSRTKPMVLVTRVHWISGNNASEMINALLTLQWQVFRGLQPK